MKKHPTILFDLDGVLVDNLRFEEAVTDFLVKSLAETRGVAANTAKELWLESLRQRKGAARWHDYSFHCQNLGIDDAWKAAHLQCKHLLKTMPGATDALREAFKIGVPCIVSDATQWVIDFKLQYLRLESWAFERVFSLDFCGTSKRNAAYWSTVDEFYNESCIYIDNRLDLLETAGSHIQDLTLVWVDSEDHPLSLQIWERETVQREHIIRVAPSGLATTLTSIVNR